MFTKQKQLDVTRDKNENSSVSFIFCLILIGSILGIYGIVYVMDKTLPTPLQISDEKYRPYAFIAERARNYLKPLTDIGPRIAGGIANEILAIDYLNKTINSIINDANLNQEIEMDIQIVSGSFYQDYKPHGTIYSYANVQNIIVKIYSSTRSNHSILINTHFDTVPTSPGGSDDGINVAIALEVLTKLSQANTKPMNNILFLFNGAEEAGLLGSHGFITKHKWAPEVRVLVNLEATGADGKELLFQTGPNAEWLIKYYNVPHPHGNAVGEEVFQSNIIPSDTDFRIFRDFGGVVGYDMAYVRDGYRYHTKFDGFDNIKFGAYQHTGDNVLQLVRNLVNAPEVSMEFEEKGKENPIFFDFLGLFFIHYSNEIGIITNVITILTSIPLSLWTYCDYNLRFSVKNLAFVTLICFMTTIAWIMSLGVSMIIGTLLDTAHRTMSWYNLPILSIGSYGVPTALCICIIVFLVNRYVTHPKLSFAQKIIIQVHVVRLMWTIILLVGTCLGLRSTYIILVPVMFNTVAMAIIQCFKLHNFNKLWPTLYLISTILPTFFLMYYVQEVLAAFIPICGRFGPNSNPEILIGLIFTLFTILILSYFAPLFAYIREPSYVMLTLGAIFMAWIILVCTPVGFPYRFQKDGPKLQRFYIYHSERTFKDENDYIIKNDFGFTFSHMDRNSPHSLKGVLLSLDKEISLEEDCKFAVNCGLPVTNSRSLNSLTSSVWIPAHKPVFSNKIEYRYDKQNISATKIKYNFIIEGSDRIDVYMSIRNAVKIASINLVDALPENSLTWNDQDTYYISFIYGKEKTPFEFNFVVETPNDFNSPTVDFAISAKFVHDDQNAKTEEYKDFLNEFPNWTVQSVAALAYYESIVLV